MFKGQESVAKVVAPEPGKTRLHEFRSGKYVEVKRAAEKDHTERGADDAMARGSTKPKLQNACMDCGKKNPKFCMPNENKKRWCAECAQKDHPEAVKTRTMKESAWLIAPLLRSAVCASLSLLLNSCANVFVLRKTT